MKEELSPRVEWVVQRLETAPGVPRPFRLWREMLTTREETCALDFYVPLKSQGETVRLIYREIQEWVYEPEEDPHLVP